MWLIGSNYIVEKMFMVREARQVGKVWCIASRDLNEISDYFLIRNLEAGEKLFREFNNKCQNLAVFPNMGRSYAHIKP